MLCYVNLLQSMQHKAVVIILLHYITKDDNFTNSVQSWRKQLIHKVRRRHYFFMFWPWPRGQLIALCSMPCLQ